MLETSVSTISRALKRAREKGIVEIRVVSQGMRLPEIERNLEKAFGLHDAIVVPTDSSLEATRTSLGRAVAEYFETLVHNGMVIGVSDGLTTAAVANNLRMRGPLNIQVVPLLGGVGVPDMPTHPIEVARAITRSLGGVTRQLNAPAMVQSASVKKILLEDPVVKSTLDVIRRCDIALVGVGAVIPEAAMVINNVMTIDEMMEARRMGAVGAICARFYDEKGGPIDSDLDTRTISIRLEELQKVKISIAVAIGDEKVPAIRAALVGKLVKVLGTDQATAEKILSQRSEHRGHSRQSEVPAKPSLELL